MISKSFYLKFRLTALSIFFIFISNISAQETETKPFMAISNLAYFERAYPNLVFSKKYDNQVEDWLITITKKEGGIKSNNPKNTAEFYWANASLLPKEEIKNKEMYWPLLYGYPKELFDPANYTEEQKEQIKNFTTTENRQNGSGTPMFFFDFLYDSNSRASLESHITKTTFLEKSTNIHEQIKEPLKRVEKRITELAKTDKETADFIENIRSADAYSWRIIAGTKRKSFHSLGIAIDILPKKQGGKQIFWDWARDKYPKTWMLIPLKDRWMPPDAVIRIFEEEGFIWGGKWVIYDNMHFEYHPELVEFNLK